MSKLMKRSRTVDTSSGTTPPASSRTSTDESPRHQRASIIVTESPDNPTSPTGQTSSSKKQRWSFAFRKRWFSSSSSRSSRTLSQSEDLESPTNISGLTLTCPPRTTLGPQSACIVSEASCSTTDRPQVEPPTPNNVSPNKRTSIRLVSIFKKKLLISHSYYSLLLLKKE